MNTVLLATICGLVTLVFWGIGDWLTSKASKERETLEVNMAVSYPEPIFLGVVLLLSNNIWPDLKTTIIIFISSTIFTLTYLLFIKALSTGDVGIVVPLSSIYPLITLLLSLLFLSVTFNHVQVGAMVAIIIGAVLLAYQKNHRKIPAREFHRETILALTAALMWGVALFIMNTMVDDLQWQVILGITAYISLIESIFILSLKYKSKTFVAMKRAASNKTALISGVCLSLGSIAFYVGATKSKSLLIPTVIASAAPLVTSLLGAIYDKEKIGLIKRLGAVIAVAGIVILNSF